MPTALIVEDEPAANQLLSRLVQLRGYQTDSAFTGNEALRKIDDQTPDLVFLDLMLPDLSGYQICESLKDRRATCSIPIVMVTARLADENRIQGYRAGAVEYVPKPYTPDQIFKAMSRATTWRTKLDQFARDGEFVIHKNDEISHLQHACDIRSLLLARTTLDKATTRRISNSVAEILQRGVDWAKTSAHDEDRIASLKFQLFDDHVALTILDESSWLKHDDPRLNGLAVLLAKSGFDCIDFRDDRELSLICDLPKS
jgi:DNA-binding response OmpR family regulator